MSLLLALTATSGGGDVTITCSVGDAVATGVSGTVNIGVACLVGNATAAGFTAALNAGISCFVGNASASGVAAQTAASINTGPGNASAAGVAATISTASNVVVTCTVGDAVASAPAAQVASTIACSVGEVVAAGPRAQLAITITGAVGDCSATGVAASILGDRSIACAPGDAAASGVLASILAGGNSATLDQILAILMGRKVYDSTTRLWRVYDANGIELADPSGILLRGLHGWLLQQAVLVASVTPAIPAQGGSGGGGKGWDRAAWRKKRQFEDAIEATLKSALSPKDRLELALDLSSGETDPEILAKIVKALTPKLEISEEVSNEWDDDEDEAVFLLLGGW